MEKKNDYDIVYYVVKGSMYDETSQLDTVYGTILSKSCKLNSWVTLKFVGNKSIFSSNESAKHFKYPMLWIS